MREGNAIGRTRFSPMEADDLLSIEWQDSQRLILGARALVEREEAEALADEPEAWSAWHDGRLVACIGITESFAGLQGVAWAVLAPGLYGPHLALTRFARSRLDACGLCRLETFARAIDIEPAIAAEPGLSGDGLNAIAASREFRTPEISWAMLLGFRPAHVLRKFGAASETMMLLERISCGATLPGEQR